jgi:hypothetical protein
MSTHHCDAHEIGHLHGPGCGHPLVHHGDHDCYLVGDHLHHATADGCQDHGSPESIDAD